jgi:hypothetical protein
LVVELKILFQPFFCVSYRLIILDKIVSGRLLARTDTRVLAIVGAGVQGQAHLRMLPQVRPFAEIRIASRHVAHAERLAATDARARAVETAEEAVRGADVVCLCTNAGEPVVNLDWLAPGMHITSVGYAPPGGELDPRVIEQGRLFVETRLAFEPPPAGCAELLESEQRQILREAMRINRSACSLQHRLLWVPDKIHATGSREIPGGFDIETAAIGIPVHGRGFHRCAIEQFFRYRNMAIR